MFAVVYLSQFSLQAVLRHEPELWKKPVALVDPLQRPPMICDGTEQAFASGVVPGLTPTQAMARCSTVLIRSRSLEQEETATAALLQCASAFSPNLETTARGVCTLDLRGLSWMANESTPAQESSPPTTARKEPSRDRWLAWADKLRGTLAEVNLTVSIGMGPTPQVARHAARWGKGIEWVEAPAPFIASLPVEALEPSSDVAPILDRWGIRTVGELLALGQEALSERLGLEALALFAAASSTAIRPLHLARPPEHFQESYPFEPEVETLEPLLFLLRRFVDQLCPRLALRGLVAESLVLQLTLESDEQVVACLRIPQPTRDPDVLFRTLHTHLESVRTESPVRAVSLNLLPAQAEQKQLGLFQTVLSNPQQFQETLARLAAVLGPDRVGTPALENSHRPDAFRLVTPDFENAPVLSQKQDALLTAARPIRRFRPALRADVETKQGPVSIHCSLSKGKLKIVVGPWRASGHWWEPGAWEREEWDAATAGGEVVRLVHRLDGWFVEGMVD
jgi:protein ImuB